MPVSVIIPTHNEALAIGRVLADLPTDLETEVIVVDKEYHDIWRASAGRDQSDRLGRIRGAVRRRPEPPFGQQSQASRRSSC